MLAPAPEPPGLAAFEPASGCSKLEAARLTDRSRLAILLQGAAVLAHLDLAGWHLAGGWNGAAVSADGVLRLAPPSPGRGRALNQDLLLDLVARLFGSIEVTGRGQGRAAARRLARAWNQSLTALDAESAAGEILEAAPFLWRPAFAATRAALVGEHARGDGRHERAAGPSRPRRHLAAVAAEQGVSLRALLSGPEARAAWQGGGAALPARLSEAGHWRAAVAGWVEQPPESAAEKTKLATALFSLGQFEKAHKALHGLRGTRARLLRARCQYRLGQLQAAKGTIRRLAGSALKPEAELELCEVAVRVTANLGQSAAVASWVERAREAAASGALAARARLLAALAQWDLGKPERMEPYLREAEPVLQNSERAWRWHFAAGLAAGAAGRVDTALTALGRALTGDRRRLRVFEAGQIWNEIGICRARRGDLAGAERAFGHTVRLLGACEGPRKTTLALYNLAEIRLRRGRLIGVRSIVEEATLENRLAGNVRGAIQDAELWARLELAQGRAQAALAYCSEALAKLDELSIDWRRAELSTLAARALGWLGRRDEAATMLRVAGAPAADELEAEELPALWLLAGDRDGALRAAAGSPLEALWLSLLTSGEAAAEAWEPLADLEPFRAARLVFDAELVAAGCAPTWWLRRAASTLRRLDAVGLAARLEARDLGPWTALARYLEAEARPGGRPEDAGSLPRATLALFAEAGYGDVSLLWEPEEDPSLLDRSTAPPRVVLAGAGGAERLSAAVGGGTLILRARQIDDVLRVLFTLALRDFPAPDKGADREARVPRGGMVGESSALRAAQERLARLGSGEMPILISGESGTGKELAAKLVHRLSPRRDRPFVAINCAALAETLLLADLFGHVKGSFTGAERDRAGVFETARGGTVFLDEIGDLPASAQGMLLRVLQEGEVRRVGESLARQVDVRVVTATHRDLTSMVAEGAFRQDLYYRLNVAAVTLPPLRERGEDLSLLAEHFLARLASRCESPPVRLSEPAMKRLRAHDWPGNVRELENILTVAFSLRGDALVIEEEHLDLAPRNQSVGSGGYHRQVDALRKRLLREALDEAGGNQSKAARGLGLSRQALSYLVKQLELF